jgi:hypothetical protein
MSGRTFDIEDLSQAIAAHARAVPREEPGDIASALADLTLPIVVHAPDDAEEVDPTVEIIDSSSDEERHAFRMPTGRYIRYRIGVLGIGQAVETFYDQLYDLFARSTDPLLEEQQLWARYSMALFGGKPRRGGVAADDADLLAANLSRFRPNYLVLVNAGQVKHKFADLSPAQLAQLTSHINAGATSGGQRPYSLVIVTDKLVTRRNFDEYCRACDATGTEPASMQFTPHEKSSLAEHVRILLRTYTSRYLALRERATQA